MQELVSARFSVFAFLLVFSAITVSKVQSTPMERRHHNEPDWLKECWDHSPNHNNNPFCPTGICSAAPEITHGSHKGDDVSLGSTLAYVCNDGYRMIGAEVVTCVKTDSIPHWTTPPTCKEVCTSIPQVLYGSYVSPPDMFVGAMVTYTCNHGYRLMENDTIECLPQGNWSAPLPECQLITCPVIPKIVNGYHGFHDFPTRVPGTTVHYLCNTGYLMQDNDTITCMLHDGTKADWSQPMPKCTEILCKPPPGVNNGYVVLPNMHITTPATTSTVTVTTKPTVTSTAPVTSKPTTTFTVPDTTTSDITSTVPVTSKSTTTSTIPVTTKPTITSTLPVTTKPTITSTIPVTTKPTITSTIPVTTKPTMTSTIPVTTKPTTASTTPDTTTSDITSTIPVTTKPTITSTIPVTSKSTTTSTIPVTTKPTTASTTPDTTTSDITSTIPVTTKPTITSTIPVTTQPTITSTVPVTTKPTITSNVPVTTKPTTASTILDTTTSDITSTIPVTTKPTITSTVPVTTKPTSTIAFTTKPTITTTIPVTTKPTSTIPVTTKPTITSTMPVTTKPTSPVPVTTKPTITSTIPVTTKPTTTSTGVFPTAADVLSDTVDTADTIFHINDTVTYACTTGYGFIANAATWAAGYSKEAMCVQVGNHATWSASIACVRDCMTVPQVVGANHTMPSNNLVSATVRYDCFPGYTMNGSSQVTCLSTGKWSEGPVCKQECVSVPEIEHGSHSLYNTDINSTAAYVCNDGYNMIGAELITCHLTNQSPFAKWTDPPLCARVCEKVPTIDNGNHTLPNNLLVGANVTYSCYLGFEVVGESNVTCQSSGNWTELPFCTAVCVSAPFVTNAHVVRYTYNETDTVKFTCEDRYTLVGNSTLQCKGGNWSTPYPVCECEIKPIDIVFIIDGSGSLGHRSFLEVRKFVIDMVSRYPIETTRFGLLVFSTGTYLQFHLNQYINDTDGLTQRIANTSYPTGGTETYKALAFARTEMFQEKNGMRPNVSHIAIVVTDGKSHDFNKTIHQAELLKDAGVTIYSVGVGLGDEKELRLIATNDTYVFTVDKYDAITTIAGPLAGVTCTSTARVRADDEDVDWE